MREICGTVAVTAVGMFGAGGGYRILDLTLSFHHDIVDGAPAARFVADLRRMLETR
jgi:pyruvate/2-oxoglutarate dehydrogenase complex dihydrolipoamide acyltransferase (E2) component